MRVKLEESYAGEFDDTEPLELLDKWERAAMACQCSVEQMVQKALGLPESMAQDGEIDAITELIAKLTKAYEGRRKRMIKGMVAVVREGSQHRESAVLERSEGIYSDEDIQSMIFRAFSSMGKVV